MLGADASTAMATAAPTAAMPALLHMADKPVSFVGLRG